MKDGYAYGAMIVVATIAVLLLIGKMMMSRYERNRPPTPTLQGPAPLELRGGINTTRSDLDEFAKQGKLPLYK